MSELVEQNVDTAIMALIDRSDHLANQVITFERAVDEVDVEISQLSCEILRSGEADEEDFRFTVAAMRISSHLERISDLAANIAGHALCLNKKRGILSSVEDMGQMLEMTAAMVRDSVGSLIVANTDMAWDVCVRDDLVDECFQRIIEEATAAVRGDPEIADLGIQIAFAASDLEHIADQACSIAGEVIYYLEGKVVTHHIQEYIRARESDGASKPLRSKKRPRSDA